MLSILDFIGFIQKIYSAGATTAAYGYRPYNVTTCIQNIRELQNKKLITGNRPTPVLVVMVIRVYWFVPPDFQYQTWA